MNVLFTVITGVLLLVPFVNAASLIDGEAPQVLDVEFTGFVGQDFSVQAVISDNLAGVHRAEAVVYSFTCDSVQTHACTVEWCEERAQTQEVCEGLGENRTCANVTIPVMTCSRSACAADVADSDIPGVNTCVAEAKNSCEFFFREGFDSFDACVTQFRNDCFSGYCDAYSADAFGAVLTCAPVCISSATCLEDRTYSDAPIETIPLQLSQGGSFNGVWSGVSDDGLFEDGVRYEAFIVATDGASNTNDMLASDEVYGRPGYVVAVASHKSVYGVGEQAFIEGTVVATDGRPLPQDIISVRGNATPIVMNAFLTTTSPLSAGTHEVVATYVPDAVCGNAFNASVAFVVGEGSDSWEDGQEAVFDVASPEEPVVRSSYTGLLIGLSVALIILGSVFFVRKRL